MMSTWLTIVGFIVGPGGLLYGLGTWAQGRRKGRVDNVVALNTSTLSYAAEMRQDLNAANTRLDALEARLNARDAAVLKHMPWDWKVYRALSDLGHPVDEPPPLLPVEQH